MRQLRRMLPDWRHHLWDDSENLALVREHFPAFADRYEAIRFGVAKSDVARYVYMHAIGGFYLDTDYLLFRPLDEALRRAECLIPLEGADPQVGPTPPGYLGLGNAIMASKPGHPFWRDLLAHIFEAKRPELLTRTEDIIAATGPEVVTRFYLARADTYPDIALPAKNCFYPTLWRLGTATSADAATYGAHLHWGRWRDQRVDIAARNLFRRKLNGLLA